MRPATIGRRQIHEQAPGPARCAAERSVVARYMSRRRAPSGCAAERYASRAYARGAYARDAGDRVRRAVTWRTAMSSSRVEPGRPIEPAMAGGSLLPQYWCTADDRSGSRHGGIFREGHELSWKAPARAKSPRGSEPITAPLERVATGLGVSSTRWCVCRRSPPECISGGAGALQMRLATSGRRRICQPGLRQMRLGTVCLPSICTRRICSRCWRSGPSGRLSTKGNDFVTGPVAKEPCSATGQGLPV
jgi:hypothetical protein